MADVTYKEEFDRETAPALAALKKPTLEAKDIKASPGPSRTGFTSTPSASAAPATAASSSTPTPAVAASSTAVALATNASVSAGAMISGAAAATGGDLVAPPRESLVQYLPPELADEKAQRAAQLKAVGKTAQIQDVLNAILPPREYRDADGRRILQKVSPYPSSRQEVTKLQMKLDEKMQERQARENGICPVREELYSQAFDELIRQITLESPERGLLLLRVRDEVRMTLAAYQTLYSSSITFGMRKALQAEHGNSELQSSIEALEADKRKLQAQLHDQKALCEAVEKRIGENKSATEKKNEEDKQFLKFQKELLEQFLKNMAASASTS